MTRSPRYPDQPKQQGNRTMQMHGMAGGGKGPKKSNQKPRPK